MAFVAIAWIIIDIIWIRELIKNQRMLNERQKELDRLRVYHKVVRDK